MQIQQNDIQVNDEVVLVHHTTEMKSIVSRVRKADGVVTGVWLPGFEHAFSFASEATSVEEWGRPVWSLISAERPDVQPAIVITAETEGGGRRRVFGTAGVHVEDVVYPWVDEHGNLLMHGELRNIEAEPDWKAAVDVYARTQHSLRRVVDAADGISPKARKALTEVLDQALDVADGPAALTISHSRLTDVIDQVFAKVRVGTISSGTIAGAVEMLLKKDLGIEKAS